MSCRLFHKWGKWSKPFKSKFAKLLYPYFDRYEYVAEAQERTCTRCGKYEWRKT